MWSEGFSISGKTKGRHQSKSVATLRPSKLSPQERHHSGTNCQTRGKGGDAAHSIQNPSCGYQLLRPKNKRTCWRIEQLEERGKLRGIGPCERINPFPEEDRPISGFPTGVADSLIDPKTEFYAESWRRGKIQIPVKRDLPFPISASPRDELFLTFTSQFGLSDTRSVLRRTQIPRQKGPAERPSSPPCNLTRAPYRDAVPFNNDRHNYQQRSDHHPTRYSATSPSSDRRSVRVR